MPRLPILKPNEMDAEQRRVHDATLAATGRVGGGPSIAYAYAPGLWEANNAVSAYIDTCSLTPAQVRIAAMVTVRHWNSDFPWAAQARMGLAAGVAPETVEAINEGRRPSFSDAEDETVYSAARELVETGTLSAATFAAARDRLGPRRLVDLAGVVGQFTKTAMMANLAGAVAPEDAPSKLKA